jgi:transketolase
MEKLEQNFGALLRTTKLRLLQLHRDANCGHIGGNFSCIDAMMTLHHQVMGPHDRFVLSKGHSAGALYVTLWSQGKVTDQELQTFARDDSAFPGHPSGAGIPGLMFSTGSLGHGPSLAAGLALAARHQANGRQVYCLCSDGEWQEGSCWEALNFAIHQRLDNLTILVDQNGMQGFGSTAEVMSCDDLTPRFVAFGAHVQHIDGHDPHAICAALKAPAAGAPRVITLKTVKGRGLHFEGLLESHYLPLSAAHYEAARSAIEQEGVQ